MIRLFVAIDLPDAVKNGLSRICFGLPGAKWVQMDQIHLTLRFIGDVDGALFHDISSVLETVQDREFPLAIKGLGHFPPRKDPRVLWVGLEKCDELLSLRKKIDSCLVRLGVKSEKRKFAPHITLARLRKTPLSRMTTFLAGNALFSLPAFQVTSFFLYSSVLTPKGAIHTQEAVYRLNK